MPAWCCTRRLSQWLDYLLPPQRLCVPREAFTITTKKSALPSTGPLYPDNVSTPSIYSVANVQKCITDTTLGVALNQTSLLYITNNPDGRAGKGVGLRPLACWDCGFEYRRGGHGCVFCDCYVLSCRGLCVGLITRLEESYTVRCVVVCDLQTLRMGRSWPALGRRATGRRNTY